MKPPKETQEPPSSKDHYTAILIEDLKNEFKAVTDGVMANQEGIQALREDLNREVSGLRTEMRTGFSLLNNKADWV